jgi:phosphate transport system substrate-binding protein
MRRIVLALILTSLSISCSKQPPPAPEVKVDGSSTVAPISMVAAEMYMGQHPEHQVTVGISGTGGGFKKFLDSTPALRTDINDASRPISKAEMETAAKVGVQFIELAVALDGIAIVVNPQNDFCDHLTLAELRRIWDRDSSVSNWREVRAGFPDLPIKLYGPGTDSGTFDHFTEVVNGKEKRCRSDYMMSEDDNTLVQGVTGDRGALGYFGFSYYENNASKLKLLAVDGGNGKPVKPSLAAIRQGEYKPLSRPLYLYVNRESLDRPAVSGFLSFYLENAPRIVEHPKVGYVSLPPDMYAAARERLQKRTTGPAMAEHRPSSAPADLASK